MGNNIQETCVEFSKFLKSIPEYDLPEYKSEFFKQIEDIASQISQSDDPERDAATFFECCDPIQSSLLHSRTREKPLGYAGDFLLLDWIYTQKTADSGIGKLFDQMFHSYEAATAVRNRKAYFIRKCKELHERKLKRVDILDIGCGSCRDIIEAHTICNNGTQYYFHAVDHEPKAIAYAESLLEGTDVKDFVSLENANAFQFRTDKKYDLIWSAGLFDYLENRIAALLIKKVWRYLKDDGQMIFGNFSPDNPTKTGMELVGHWKLIHRSAHELIDIVNQAKVDYSSLEIEAEDLGINLFCVIRK